MGTTMLRRGAAPRALLGLLLAALVGCGPKPAEPAGAKLGKDTDEKPGQPAGREITELALPKSMVIGKNVTLSGFYDDDLGAPPEGKVTDERPTQGPKDLGGASQNLYRLVAPATVIVRSQQGYGTGVIYDPAGWVLTNHHVVARAELDNFRLKVSIGLGQLSKEGTMEPGATYEAYVHKQDPQRDLAVLKIVSPPKNLASVRLAAKDPVPGQSVTSIGHAGIGLLWAIKTGQISAIGKLSSHLAELQLYARRKKEAASGAEPEDEKMKAARLEELRKELEKSVPALVIQSTADISQGDSGGPLVNDRAEIVGLNAFVRSTYFTRKESNFHIHVAEMRKFIKDVPKRAPQLLPNPWTEGGTMAELGDADLDSAIDVLALYQVISHGFFSRKEPTAYFLDLDQDSFKSNPLLPEVAEVVEKKSLDAELTYLAHGAYLYAWYDTNADAKPDVLLLADGTTNKVTGGYRVGPAGEVTPDHALDEGTLIRPALFSDAALGQRLSAVGPQIFNYHLLPAGSPAARVFPDPVKSAGHRGSLKDLSGDGRPDTIAAEGLFSSGFVFDADQDSLGQFQVNESLRAVQQSGKKIDAEFSWITLSRDFWAWYDTNNDGTFDLLLHAYRMADYAQEAWRVGGDGKLVPDASFNGRKIVQPELLSGPGQAEGLRRMVEKVVPTSRIATGGGIKSFPDPTDYYRWGYRLKDVKQWKQVVVEVRLASCNGVLVDVDHDTLKKGKKEKKSVEEMVRDKKFDAEFAEIDCGSEVWAFYDSRGSGSFDTVLYTPSGISGTPAASYVVGAGGQVALREPKITCAGMVIPALFRKPELKRTFGQMAPTLFSSVAATCKP